MELAGWLTDSMVMEGVESLCYKPDPYSLSPSLQYLLNLSEGRKTILGIRKQHLFKGKEWFLHLCGCGSFITFLSGRWINFSTYSKVKGGGAGGGRFEKSSVVQNGSGWELCAFLQGRQVKVSLQEWKEPQGWIRTDPLLRSTLSVPTLCWALA